MVICLGSGPICIWYQPLPLTISCSSKSRLVLPFCYQLTRVVPDKIQKSCKTIVVVVVVVVLVLVVVVVTTIVVVVFIIFNFLFAILLACIH